MGGAPEKTILASLVEGEFGTDEENELVEEFFDEEASITPTEQSYLDSLSAVRPQPFNDTGVVTEDYLTTNQEGTAIKKQDAAQTKKVKQPRTEIVYYSVEAGDTVSTIADNFDLSVNSILWENNLNAYSLLHPGDKLAILPQSGISHAVTKGESLQGLANLYNIGKEIIADANKLNVNSGLIIGQKIIIPGGKKLSYASAERTSYSGFEVLKELTRPFTKKAVPSASPIRGNKMNWPTAGYKISQYYSWRHHAVDIPNKIGTPIYAADSGIIEVAGWGRGYGNTILINHGGGKKTRYGHLSKFYVGVGDRVTKGQAIGAMGSTGWSTGSHLHFEVIIDNIKYNPLNYIR